MILNLRGKLLLKVKRAPNWLYKLTMPPMASVCLDVRHETSAW
jgi:hypothetical protein